MYSKRNRAQRRTLVQRLRLQLSRTVVTRVVKDVHRMWAAAPLFLFSTVRLCMIVGHAMPKRMLTLTARARTAACSLI